MTTLRRLFAGALVVHGSIHVIGFIVAWELATLDGFAFSTEVIGGIDIGTSGVRILGIAWLVATAAFIVAGLGVLRRRPWAFTATMLATAFSSLTCLIQVDQAWRGLAIDLVLALGITTWWTFRLIQRIDTGAM